MAEAATLDAFRAQFPNDFTSLADSIVQRALDEACQVHAVRTIATLYAAAHFLKLDELEATGELPAGEIESEQAGPLRASYVTQAAKGSNSAFWARTEYGRRFLIHESRTPKTGIGILVA